MASILVEVASVVACMGCGTTESRVRYKLCLPGHSD